MTVFVVKCPKCGSDQCFPTHIDADAMCIPCGHEFSMLGPWWYRVWLLVTGRL